VVDSRCFRHVVAVFVLVGLVGSGCGLFSDPPEQPLSASPLNDYLGEDLLLFAFDDEREEQFLRIEADRQAAIQTCMNEAGHHYEAPDLTESAVYGVMGDTQWGTPEWVATYGLGISTLAFTQDEVGAGLVGGHDPWKSEHPPVNPNAAIIEALDEAEQIEYLDTLLGVEGQPDGGCELQATRDTGSLALAVLVDLQPEITDLRFQVQNDAALNEAEEELGSCLAGEGLPYLTLRSLEQEFQQSVELLREQIIADSLAPDGGQDRENLGLDGEQANPVLSLSHKHREVLGRLQRQEVEYAVAMETCGFGLDERQVLWQKIAVPYETAFIDAHREVLDQLKSEHNRR